MKFIQIAQSLALVGTAAAASYTNTSFVPYGSGYFLDNRQLVYNLVLPNSGFSAFDISTKDSGFGYTLFPPDVSAIYSPSEAPIVLTFNDVNNILDVSADVTLYHEKSVDVTFQGETIPILGPNPPENYTAEFIISLKGLPQPIEKRAEQEFTITVVATHVSTTTPSPSPSLSTTTTTTETTTATTTATETITTCFDGHCITLVPVTVSTKTVASTTLVTITSCEKDICHTTVVPTGVTCVTLNSTTFTTFCPITTIVCEKCVPISTTVIKTKTECITSNNVTITKNVIFTTTECNFFTTVSPTIKPTTVTPTTTVTPVVPTTTITPVVPTTTITPVVPTTTIAPVVPTTTVASIVKTTSVAPAIVSPTATFQGNGSKVSGSIFAVFAFLVSMFL
jgi:hypothetical protein